MKQETFKTIENFSNYEVSSYGRVKNVETGKFLKPYDNGNGYLQVQLFNTDGRKALLVHRIVAQAFLENPGNLATVDHINGDKTNNNVENLQWMTQADNTRKANNKRVNQYNTNGDFIATYVSITEASRQTGADDACIGNCCAGRRLTAGSYIWKYEEI